jgi:hypothetical protein
LVKAGIWTGKNKAGVRRNDTPACTLLTMGTPTGQSEPATLRPSLRFPVTLLISIQYLPLAVGEALIYDNPYLPFIVSVVAVALVTSFIVELALGGVPRRTQRDGPRLYPTAAGIWTITSVGALATLGSGWLGAGTYETQVGLAAASPLTALLTPLTPWTIFGCAFGLVSWRTGGLSKPATLLLMVMAVAAQVIFVLRVGITAPLMNFVFALGAGAALVGFLRPRWLWVALAAAVLMWPVLYDARNATRQEITGSSAVSASSGLDGQYRFREDLLLQQAVTFGRVSGLPQPGVVDVLRFGLIPRALDRHRGELPSGKELNAAMGGSSTSSNTFTVLGSIWSLNGGYAGVAGYVCALSIVCTAVCRRVTPITVAMFMLIAYCMVWIESTYPDNVISVLQGVVSLAVAMGVAMVIAGRHAHLRRRGVDRGPVAD